MLNFEVVEADVAADAADGVDDEEGVEIKEALI